MTSSELRRSFLEYFQRHGHRIVPSSPLVPHGDATLLFTNAGMNQFKDVFLGREQRGYSRATTSQKCMRVSGKHNDLDNVGPSLRHHTFFEMLGNFSFGDYFKHDAIALRLGAADEGVGPRAEDKLFATIFKGEDGIPRDDEAYTRWLDFVPADRIVELGAADNFWSMGDTGPCGRCSEIHYFRGNDLPCSAPTCLGPACDCDRFVEIWNNVFMEFDRQPGGALLPLPKPSIDTGMGLERIAAVKKGTLSNYDTDVFAPLLVAIEARAWRIDAAVGAGDVDGAGGNLDARGRRPPAGDDVSHRRRRAAEQRVARLRAAQDHAARDAARQAPRVHRAGPARPGRRCSSRTWATRTPNCARGRDTIVQVIRAEEHRFDAVLTNGLPKLEELLDRAARDGDRRCPATTRSGSTTRWACRWTSSRTWPASASWRSTARASTARWRRSARRRARSSAFEGKRAEEPAFDSPETAERLRASGEQFEGYTATTVEGATITALLDADRRQVPTLPAGSSGLRAARPHAVLPGVRRPGVRHRRPPQRGRHRRRARGGRRAARRRVAPRAQGDGDRRRARRGPARDGACRRASARRDAPQPHGDPPDARRACARCWART